MITMITGGAGAGKTSYALKLAENYPRKAYIATAESTDSEMQAKIDAHKAERDETYKTVEEPLELSGTLDTDDVDVIIIDCVTFWVNNLIYYKKDEDEYFDNLISTLKDVDKPVVIVTNEVGLGIIPWESETRRYAKLLARINRKIAGISDGVIMMVSGIPMRVK